MVEVKVSNIPNIDYVIATATVVAFATVDLEIAPDLVVLTGSPKATPSAVLPGGAVTLSGWTVKNRGTLASDTFQWLLPFDRCNHNDSGHLPGWQRQHEFGGRGPVCLGRAYPDDTGGNSTGNYYVGILVDRNNTSAESNETNNYVSRQMTVMRPGASLGPDLVIITSSPAVTPSTVAPGSRDAQRLDGEEPGNGGVWILFQWLLPFDRCNHNDSGHLPGRQRQHEFGGRGPVCLGRAYPDDTGGNSAGKLLCGDSGGSDQHIC